jgi:hypothetical protein
MPRMPIPASVLNRFWAKVNKDGPIHEEHGQCWNWLGGLTFGYGNFCALGEGRAHRVSYIIHNGKIPKGLFVLHKCDNPSCVNPKHLFLGTQKDNVADCVTKGRFATGERSPSRVNIASRPRGENHCFRRNPEKHAKGEGVTGAKLTEEQVKYLRTLPIKWGDVSRLAREYGISQGQMWKVLHGTKWKHVK